MRKQSMGRVVSGVALAACALLVAACPKPPILGDVEPPAMPVRIAPGETVSAEFAPDELWHESGFMAVPGDRIMFSPMGPAKHVAKKALLVHIGRTRSQLVHAQRPQLVEQAGEIRFRVDRTYLGPFPDPTVRIAITNFREPNE